MSEHVLQLGARSKGRLICQAYQYGRFSGLTDAAFHEILAASRMTCQGCRTVEVPHKEYHANTTAEGGACLDCSPTRAYRVREHLLLDQTQSVKILRPRGPWWRLFR